MVYLSAKTKACIAMWAYYKIKKRRNLKKKDSGLNGLTHFFLNRPTFGLSNSLIPELLINDLHTLRGYLKADVNSFEKLISKLEPFLKKNHHTPRLPISAKDKIIASLRFFSTGLCYSDHVYDFRMAKSTIHNFLYEVCIAIISVLGPEYMATPTSQEQWNKIASDFYQIYGFPNCVGALDGKHIRIRKPPGSSTSYFNYKKFYSIVLLAVSSSDRKFIHAEVGINGVISDGGVFYHSELKKRILDNELNLPDNKLFVADSAFPLRKDLMKPFIGRNLNLSQQRFNNELSKTRGVVEHCFGILTSRFKCLRNSLNVTTENAKLIVLACCVLHNFLATESPESYLARHEEDQVIELPSVNSTGGNDQTNEGVSIRQRYCLYFDGHRNLRNS